MNRKSLLSLLVLAGALYLGPGPRPCYASDPEEVAGAEEFWATAGSNELRKKPYKARVNRAIVLTAKDGDNIIRQWISNYVAQVAASSTFADFKSKVAALGGLPQITAGQARGAVTNKIQDQEAD